MTATHIAVFTAMQNARRLIDSGATISTTDAIILASILMITLVVFCWLISKT